MPRRPKRPSWHFYALGQFQDETSHVRGAVSHVRGAVSHVRKARPHPGCAASHLEDPANSSETCGIASPRGELAGLTPSIASYICDTDSSRRRYVISEVRRRCRFISETRIGESSPGARHSMRVSS